MCLPRLIQWPAKANWNELKEKYQTAGGVLIVWYDDVDDDDNNDDNDDDLYDKDNDDACRWWVWDKMRRKRNSGKRRREWQVHIFAHIFCIFLYYYLFYIFFAFNQWETWKDANGWNFKKLKNLCRCEREGRKRGESSPGEKSQGTGRRGEKMMMIIIMIMATLQWQNYDDDCQVERLRGRVKKLAEMLEVVRSQVASKISSNTS